MSTIIERFEQFLSSVDLKTYRETYRPIKIVEMDLPKEIQAIQTLYKIYWTQKKFVSFENFYQEYFETHRKQLRDFQQKIGMCPKCFNKGLPARIYRTWASIVTQIHAGYVAESIFGAGTVSMSLELDHKGADFQVLYKGRILNYQVKKKSLGREVRQDKPKVKNPLLGEFVDIKYEVPSEDYFTNPKKKNGTYKLPYKRFRENKELKRFPNGFIVFTSYAFERKKLEIEQSLK